jgi:NAD-dependent deacetylase
VKTKMKIVVLTGAGISAESGISTYRDKDGMWLKYDSDRVASASGMKNFPHEVIDFHNKLRAEFKDKKPNDAHFALAMLEEFHDVTIVTQNIDNLHELAGSTKIIHVHGDINKAINMLTGEVIVVSEDLDPYGKYRPDTVLFGENPKDFEALDAMYECDVFIAIGTSGHVFPAAAYVDMVNNVGKCNTIEVNLTKTNNSHKFKKRILGAATKVVPILVNELINTKR